MYQKFSHQVPLSYRGMDTDSRLCETGRWRTVHASQMLDQKVFGAIPLR